MSTRALIYVWMGATLFGTLVVWSLLVPDFGGLIWFSWTPFYAAWVVLAWFIRREARKAATLPKMPTEHDLDRELRDLLEREGKK